MRNFLWSRPELRKEHQTAAIEALRVRGLKTPHDVEALLTWLVEPVVSHSVNCREKDHSAPFDFLCDILMERVHDFIVWANRSGSKSYLAGLVTWVKSSFMPRLETTILGGSLEQSEKSYKAMNDFWFTTGLQDDYLADEPMKSKTNWRNGSTVAVLTASQRSVRGPHTQRLLMDEIDEMEEEIYQAALSIPQSKHSLPSGTGKFSTNHRVGGVMDSALNKAGESGTRVYKWCIWECLQSCRDYECSTCKLTAYCPGTHMKEATGYYLVEDFVKKMYDLSDVSLNVEWFCRKVGRDDLVYGHEYDEDIHSPLNLPGMNLERPVYISLDWGGTDPFSVGFWQEFKGVGWIRVGEYYKGNTTNQQVIAELKKMDVWKRIKEGVADPSRADLIKEWKDAGKMIYRADNEVDVGIEAMRNSLKPVLGNPKFYVNRICKAWRREAGSYYEKNGKPVDENNHTMDETRYFVMRYIRPRKTVRVRRLI